MSVSFNEPRVRVAVIGHRSFNPLRRSEPVARDHESQEALRCELFRARHLCRALSDTVPENRRTDFAAAFVRWALEALSSRVAAGYRLSAPFVLPAGCLDDTARQLAETIGKHAAALPLDEGLNFVTSLYPAMLSASARGALGAYYTPLALTTRLIDQVSEHGVDWRSVRVLDPATGGGAFLVQVADRMRHALAETEPAFILAHLGSRLLGFELDAHAAGLAQSALEILLADLSIACGRPIPVMVRICDSLEEPACETFGLVIGNPPYGRVSLSDEQRRRYRRSLYGHANLYGVFTDIALRWTKPGGLVAYVTPTSLLAGQYFAALRNLLAQEAPPVAIDFVHARRGVFEDVLQETMLAVYRRGAVATRAQIHYLHVGSERQFTLTRNGTIGLPANAKAPWLAPRDPKHGALVTRVEKMTTRLSDWGYDVSTGPLVWNRFKSQLCETSGGKGRYPLIWAEAVTADGRFVFRAQKKNHAPFFKLNDGDDWLLVRQSCVLVQRTTAKEQARRLIAAELPSDFVARYGAVVVENHLNMIRARVDAIVPPAVVAALLNSRVVDEVFRCMSGSVAVSAFELGALPLPDPKDLARLTHLLAVNAERESIEAECDRLYGRAGP